MGKRILIIDGNRSDRNKSILLLNGAGYSVMTAADGVEGVRVALRGQPDLILSEMQLPFIDGMEVARRLKSHAETRYVPIIGLSALEMVGDRRSMVEEFFDGFISKPVNPDRFAALVGSALARGVKRPRRIELPLPGVPRQIDPARAPSPAVHATPAPDSEARQPSLKNPRILMIDDSGVNVDLFARSIEIDGYETIPCMNSTDAEDMARKYEPDLVVSDILMPDRDGYAVLNAFKADPKLRKIPFVLITSSLWPERDREIGMLLGAAKFIHRPIDPPVLAAEITEVLEKRKGWLSDAGHTRSAG